MGIAETPMILESYFNIKIVHHFFRITSTFKKNEKIVFVGNRHRPSHAPIETRW